MPCNTCIVMYSLAHAARLTCGLARALEKYVHLVRRRKSWRLAVFCNSTGRLLQQICFLESHPGQGHPSVGSMKDRNSDLNRFPITARARERLPFPGPHPPSPCTTTSNEQRATRNEKHTTPSAYSTKMEAPLNTTELLLKTHTRFVQYTYPEHRAAGHPTGYAHRCSSCHVLGLDRCCCTVARVPHSIVVASLAGVLLYLQSTTDCGHARGVARPVPYRSHLLAVNRHFENPL